MRSLYNPHAMVALASERLIQRVGPTGLTVVGVVERSAWAAHAHALELVEKPNEAGPKTETRDMTTRNQKRSTLG